jgi:hypothetical protein
MKRAVSRTIAFYRVFAGSEQRNSAPWASGSAAAPYASPDGTLWSSLFAASGRAARTVKHAMTIDYYGNSRST